MLRGKEGENIKKVDHVMNRREFIQTTGTGMASTAFLVEYPCVFVEDKPKPCFEEEFHNLICDGSGDSVIFIFQKFRNSNDPESGVVEERKFLNVMEEHFSSSSTIDVNTDIRTSKFVIKDCFEIYKGKRYRVKKTDWRFNLQLQTNTCPFREMTQEEKDELSESPKFFLTVEF